MLKEKVNFEVSRKCPFGRTY